MRRYAVFALLAVFVWATLSFADSKQDAAAPQANPAENNADVSTALQAKPAAKSANAPAAPRVKPVAKNANGAAAPGRAAESTKPDGDEKQSPPIASTVKCAIVLADGDAIPDKAWLSNPDQCHNAPDAISKRNPTAGLNDTIYLLVQLGTDPSNPTKISPVLDDWRLSINGIAISDGKLTWEASVSQAAIISAKLTRTDTSKADWDALLAPKLQEHTVRVTLIDPGKKPLASSAFLNLQVVKLCWYGWLLFAILFILFAILVTNDRLKEMLRDDGPHKSPDAPASGPVPASKAAYSLARVQMFYWFSITILCYVVIWIITGDRDTVNNDVLALMGISAGTFLGADWIDASKKSQAQSDLPDATAKLQQIQATVAALTTTVGAGQPATIAASQAENSQQEAVKQLTDQTLADYNENFLTDILSDEDGLSFHRFQMFSWSLVLGVIFVASVVQTLAMPTFGNTLLGLMGISGGTYLGFKFPEQKTK